MSFTDHKITAFAHKIADLPDQPTLPPDELKSRFDACPEELRQSLNAVCDDAARLEARVEGIVVDTFGDTIDKEMLSDELAAELDAKAVEGSVASRFSAEQTARESGDSSLSEQIATLQSAVAQKCEIFLGTYTGDGQDTRTIPLDFTPKALFIIAQNGAVQAERGHVYGGMAFPDVPCVHSVEDSSKTAIEISGNGFIVRNGQVASMHNDWIYTNRQDMVYLYVAMK